MALFMHTPATLRDLEAALEEFRSRIEAVAGQLEAARIDEPLGIDYQVRVEKALEGLNAFLRRRGNADPAVDLLRPEEPTPLSSGARSRTQSTQTPLIRSSRKQESPFAPSF